MQMAGMPCLSCSGRGWLEVEEKDPQEAEGIHTPSIPEMPNLPPPPPGPAAPPPVPKDKKEEKD